MLTDEQKIAQYQDKINRIKQKKRKTETGQKVIIGGMMLSLAYNDPEIAQKLNEWIKKNIDRDSDLKRLEPVIAKLDKLAHESQKEEDPYKEFASQV